MLIGESEERLRYLQESEKELRQSEEADTRREQEETDEENQQRLADERLEDLRRRRESKVPSEPDMNEEHVVVCVRHPDLGVVTRAFRPYETINAVYNWIGSLQKVPEHFRFYLPRGHVLTSEQSVELASRCTLTMEVCEADDLAVPSSSVALSTDAQHTQGYTPQREIWSESSIQPPRILLEDDEIVCEEDSRAFQLLQSLEERRQEALQFLPDEKHVIISKNNVVQEMLNLYADECLWVQDTGNDRRIRCYWRRCSA